VESDRARVLASAQRRAFRVALALVLAPLVVLAVTVLHDAPRALVRDHALIELQVRDVGRHPVLIGLYSRDGWSHPGPLLYYTLALPYRLTGSNPTGLLLGALAINAAAIAGMGAIAKRLGGMPAALLTLVGVSVVARALGAELLLDPWVCFVTVLPFGLFCFLAWAMTMGEAWALPAAGGVASWLVQVHVGYAPLITPALGAGAVWLWIVVRRRNDPAATKKFLWAAIVAVVIVAVAWAPPLWDQVFGSGNLAKVVDWFASADAGAHTLTEGARVVFGQFAAVPDWITGKRRVAAFGGETTLRHTTLLPLLLAPFVLAAIVAWRRRDRALVRLAAILALTLVASVISVARTVGIMYEYRLLWTWVLGALAGVVVAWTGWSIVVKRWPQAQTRALVPLALLTLAVLCAVESVAAVRAGTPDWDSPATATVTGQLASRLDTRRGEVLLRSESAAGEGYVEGIVLALERRSVDARVAADPTDRFGAHRVATGAPVQAHLVVLADTDLDGFVRQPGLDLVAYAGRVPFDQRVDVGRRAIAERRRLLAAFNSGDMPADAFARAFEASQVRGSAVAVFREQP
jgi:hypothetical protein